MTLPQKGRIFISYRRADSQFAAGRIYDRLSAYFGEEAIFMDVEAIDGGVDFVKVLEDAVQTCDVVIVLIGQHWLSIKDERGERRLDNPEDFVRVEVATALERDIRVIPVLVESANMPRSTEFPENLKPLARRNALQVNHRSFNADANRLTMHIERALKAVEDSRMIIAERLKEERENALLQAEIKKLLVQVDAAINKQHWALAKGMLKDILSLDANHAQAQIKSEIVDARLLESFREKKSRDEILEEKARNREKKQQQVQDVESRRRYFRGFHENVIRSGNEKREVEEKVRQDVWKKERQRAGNTKLKNYIQDKSSIISVGIFIFACLMFGGNYLLQNLFASPLSAATKYIATEALPATVLATSTPVAILNPDIEISVEIVSVINLGVFNAEVVSVRNRGEVEVDLVGWHLEDEDKNVFVFPQLILYPEGAVRVHTMAGQDNVVDLYWGLHQSVWELGEEARLIDAQGIERATYKVQ